MNGCRTPGIVTSTLPLLPEAASDTVMGLCRGRLVTRAEFVGQVNELARRLPDVDQVMNLCVDRYWFSVALLACMARGIVSLLPHSGAPDHLAALAEASPGLVCLGDAAESIAPQLPYLRVDELALCAGDGAAGEALVVPQIPVDRCVARVFTSGSTGQPQGHDKYFGGLWRSVQAAAERIWPITGGACSVVGTSSFRHMFGFEAAVLLPLWRVGG